MLRAEMLKILLQQYRHVALLPVADIRDFKRACTPTVSAPTDALFFTGCERDHTAVAVPPFINRSVDHMEMRLERRRGSSAQPAQNRRNPMPRSVDVKRLNLSHSEQAMIKKCCA
jgi:hypothetical protein